MSIEKTIEFVKKKVPWTSIAVIISLLFGALGSYATLHEKKPEVVYEITNEVDVVNIRKPLDDLTIRFKQEDIQKKNLNLRILTIRIKNSGEQDILQSHYDKNIDWGILVEGGEIIDVRLIDSNSSYLKKNLNPKLFDSNTIHFTKVIFERTQFFILEILTLHSKDLTPSIIPIGKIAGIKKINIFKSDPQKSEDNFLHKAYSGDLEVQAARSVGYFLFFFVSLIFVGAILFVTDDTKKKWRKNNRKKEIGLIFKNVPLKGKYKELISDAYINGKFNAIKEIDILMNNDKLLALYFQKHLLLKEQRNRMEEVNSQINELRGDNRKGTKESAISISELGSKKGIFIFESSPGIFIDLLDKDLVRTTENKIVADDELKSGVSEILKQLENKRKKS